MQPTYLPWSGYFNLISSSDCFVFLDDVQFEKQSWQNRNRIAQNSNILWLTVPLEKAKLDCMIKDIKISSSSQWKKKHIRSLSQSYAKARFSEEILSMIIPILERDNKFLIDLTIPIISKISKSLGFNKTLIKSSELQQQGKKSEKLINICNHLKANKYLSPLGAKVYLDNDKHLFYEEDIIVKYQHYEPEEYSQIGDGVFIPYMSVVDMIANCGFESAKNYINKGEFK